jgi:thiol-disulfide isomerase/thioredoxin
MEIKKGTVRAPEIGRIWLNSPPLSLRQLRGRAVLIDFWDYTCVNCVRTLPYVQEWHRRYHDKGLIVIGVHTPEFTFAQQERNVERGVHEFGLSYPIVIDSNYELWQAFANRYWPAKYLIDHEGYIRYAHFGEGAYGETEATLQSLLCEIDPQVALPQIMRSLRDTDEPGAICYRPTPELYLGYKRGHIGNASGFVEDNASRYDIPLQLQEGAFYLQGEWRATAEYAELAVWKGHIKLMFSAAAVNLVMACSKPSGCEVEILQDGQPLSSANATPDIILTPGESKILVNRARMYSLVDNSGFGAHTLELICREPGLQAYAFTFTSCVDAGAGKESSTGQAAR